MTQTLPEGYDSANQPQQMPGRTSRPETEPAVTKGEHGFVIHGNPAPIFIALAKAKLEFKAIERTKLVKVRSEKGSYDFWYAPLEAVIGAVDEALGKHGLSQFQPLAKEGNSWVLRTILAHSSGSYVECTADLPQAPDWQKLGGAITYCRRYMLGSLLGVAPDEDDDGTTAEGMHRETESREAKPRQNTRPTPPAPPAKVEPKPEPKAAPSSPPPAPAASAPTEAPKPGVAMTEEATLRVRSLVRAKAWNGQPLKPPFTDQFFRSVLGPEIGVREANASHTEALIAALESLPDVAS